MTVSDSRAWVDAVVRKNDGDLKRYLARRVGSGADAQDLAQEVYLRLLRVDRTDLIRCPEAFLFRLAAHAVYEWHMRARNRLPHSSEWLDDMTAPGEPSDDVWRAQLATELTGALQRLTPKCRAAVLLHRREELSYREVGQKLGLSTESVKKYLMRGIAECREHLQRRLGTRQRR